LSGSGRHIECRPLWKTSLLVPCLNTFFVIGTTELTLASFPVSNQKPKALRRICHKIDSYLGKEIFRIPPAQIGRLAACRR
jgi:hypothetical protein